MIAVVPDALRIALGFVFLVSAFTKLTDVRSFERSVRDYAVLPRTLEVPFVWAILTSEVGIAGLLLVNVAVPFVNIAALVLLLIFGIAIAVSLARGRRPACGCFGLSSEPVSRRSLMRIGVLIGADLGAAYGPAGLAVSVMQDQIAEAFLRLTLGFFVFALGAWLLLMPRPFQRWIDLVAEIRSGGTS